jgi:hypothetical protein
MTQEGTTMASKTPSELAKELGIDPKRRRDWLRLEFPRHPAEHGARWHIDDNMSAAARIHFSRR